MEITMGDTKKKNELLKQQFLETVGSEHFRNPYERACELVTQKIREISSSISVEIGRGFVKDINSRVKSPESCLAKMENKKYPINAEMAKEKLSDIAGVRAVCYFVDDVYKLADKLMGDDDLEFEKLKDYVKKPKSSGYQSLHLILKVPVYDGDEKVYVKTEVQLRTQAMDFWSNIEHHFIYKENGKDLSEYEEEFVKCSKAIQKLDKQMLKIRKKMQHERFVFTEETTDGPCGQFSFLLLPDMELTQNEETLMAEAVSEK